VVGPTFYGNKVAVKVTNINEATTTYTPEISSVSDLKIDDLQWSLYPNPASETLTIQSNKLVEEKIDISLLDVQGKIVQTASILPGTTISFMDIRTLHTGNYILQFSIGTTKFAAQQIAIQ
jgi:hypothetical protein